MPAPPRPDPPNGTARVAISGLVQTHRWVNVFWLDLTHSGDPLQTDFQNVVASMYAAYYTGFAPSLSSSMSFEAATGEWYLAGESLGASVVSHHAGGDAAAEVKDAASTFVIDWLISARYRGGHPRTYLPGVTEDIVINGAQISGARQTDLATKGAAFITAVNALTHGGISATLLGTVSFQHALAWRTPPVFRPYLGASVYPYLGTQRRRIRS